MLTISLLSIAATVKLLILSELMSKHTMFWKVLLIKKNCKSAEKDKGLLTITLKTEKVVVTNNFVQKISNNY